MKNLYFDDFGDLACSIADKFDELDKENFDDIAVIAKYDEVKEVFKELVCIGYDICSITLDMPDRYGYNDEYILGLSNDGLWIEKFKRENGYFEDESTVIYVLDNCSSKVIPYCKGKTLYEVTIGEEDCDCDECECDCWNELDECESTDKSVTYTKDDDGDTHGFIASRSDGNSCYGVSFYSTDKLSMRDIQSLMQECGF